MIVWQLPSKEVQRIDTNHRWRCHAQARHMVGMAVPQLGQPRPCAIRVLQRSLEDGARRHRYASKEHMEYNPAVEDELLVEVQRAEVAFVGASHRCKELGTDRVTECMEPASRN
jgi:hypothetical protein